MTSTFSQAFCNRAPTAVSPMRSMVVILALRRLPTGVWHERWAAPFTWTVQAPQRPAPHPYLVPTRPSSSRNTHNKGISGGASNWRTCPLIFSSYFIALLHPEDDSCLVCHRSLPPLPRIAGAATWRVHRKHVETDLPSRRAKSL